MRIGLTGVLIFVVAAFSADVPRGQIASEDVARLGKVCKHYINRARFKPRHQTQEFVVTLADGCRSAKLSLLSENPAERMAAARFLTGLQNLRDEVIDMNMTRVFGETYTPFTRMKYKADQRVEAVRKVSGTGEYLIAHRMGLIQAYHAWLDTGPHIALVSDGETAEP